MRSHFILKLVVVVGLWPLSVFASFPQIAPQIRVALDPAHQDILVHGQVRNAGDVSARDVSLDFPEQNTRVTVARNLGPGDSVTVQSRIALTPRQLQESLHSPILYRVVFRDENGYLASAIYWKNPVSSQISPLRFEMGSADGVPQVYFLKDEHGDFQIKNITSSPIEKLDVQFFLPLEIQGGISAHDQDLAPQAEMSVKWQLKNFNGLVGAGYAGLAVIRGVSNGQPFAETHVFAIHLSDAPPIFGFASRATFFALLWVAGSLVYFRYRRRQNLSPSRERREATIQ